MQPLDCDETRKRSRKTRRYLGGAESCGVNDSQRVKFQGWVMLRGDAATEE